MAEQYTCLLVDIDHGSVASEVQAKGLATNLSLPLQVANSLEEAYLALNQEAVVLLALFANEYSSTVEAIIKAYQRYVGCLPEFQLIVCDDPSPQYLNQVFEFGLEQFAAARDWQLELEAFMERAQDTLLDKDSSELLCIQAMRALEGGDLAQMARFDKRLVEMEAYDYLAAYTRAKLLDAMGMHQEAYSCYVRSEQLNQLFRPARLGKSQSLLVLKLADKAVSLLEELSGTNPKSVDLKINLSIALSEMGWPEKAASVLEQAKQLNPHAPEIETAQIHYLLASKQTKEAVTLISQLKLVEPRLISKLNELAVRLAQAGKTKSALLVYKKVHASVAPGLRYKISLNAALACHRGGHLQLALQYCQRSKDEYGRYFPKLQRVEQNIKAIMATKNRAS